MIAHLSSSANPSRCAITPPYPMNLPLRPTGRFLQMTERSIIWMVPKTEPNPFCFSACWRGMCHCRLRHLYRWGTRGPELAIAAQRTGAYRKHLAEMKSRRKRSRAFSGFCATGILWRKTGGLYTYEWLLTAHTRARPRTRPQNDSTSDVVTDGSAAVIWRACRIVSIRSSGDYPSSCAPGGYSS